jgi:phosphoribosylformimino-5-aminoimidazole carboxamide ribonucleotide (ProFAR) isomerase
MIDDKVVNLQKVRSDKKQKSSMRMLEASASYVSLEKCLKYLEMSDLKELVEIKKNMKEVMKKLIKIGKNG